MDRNAHQKSNKSEEKARLILQAAHEIISEVGLRNISLRSIARQCGMHLKTLQHYFPTKNDLMKAIYNELMEKYLPPLEEILQLPEDPLPRFNMVLDQLFGFVEDLNNQRFFMEIFSIAQNDDEWMQMVDRKFSSFYNQIGDLLAELNPTLNRREGRRRSLAMGAMMEGMMLFLGDNKPIRPERENLEDEIRGLLLLMATAPKLVDHKIQTN
ncbi:MAG: TetR/AcrR family transcriptional regulator [Emcibacter sp.]|nr:TetR/AcrR family transcriptional regulator [Emcibacter sp.]